MIMASRRSALDLAEDAARSYSEIILLTDWDRKGDEMAKKIELHLVSVGSRPDTQIRSQTEKAGQEGDKRCGEPEPLCGEDEGAIWPLGLQLQDPRALANPLWCKRLLQPRDAE